MSALRERLLVLCEEYFLNCPFLIPYLHPGSIEFFIKILDL